MYEFKVQDAWDFARSQRIEVKEYHGELQFYICPYCGGGKKRDTKTFSINLTTGQCKCLRASCSVSGNMLTISKDFNFSLGTEIDAYYSQKQDTYRKFKKSKEPIKPKAEAVKYLEARGIPAAVVEKYQITVQKDKTNVLVFPFLDEKGEMCFVKYRNAEFDPKTDNNKEWCERNGKPILFGMYQCNLENKTLIITEGQIDSLSLAAVGIENAVSVPTGKNGFTWFPHCYDFLKQFETLIVFGDYERGEISLLAEMKRRFAGKVKVVRGEDYKGCKDANEILKKFGRQVLREAVQNARDIPVQQVKALSEVKSVDLFSLPKIKTGISEIDEVLSGGIYLGQVVILTGKRGDGKSTLASQILVNTLEQGKTIFAYSGELQDYFFKRWIDLQIAGQHNVINRVNTDGGTAYYITKTITEKINQWYKDRAYIFDNQVAEDSELLDLLEIMERSIRQYGIELLLLDNLMTVLDVGMNVDLYRAQSKFVDKLVKMAKRLNVAIILVVHPRKNNFGTDDTDEVSGSSDITNKVDIVMTYKRKKDSPPNERVLSISKNRLTGKLAVGGNEIQLYYDMASKRISSRVEDFKYSYGWERDKTGFTDVTEQMEIPFE